jgi:mono/diheme cytochrome c family protein
MARTTKRSARVLAVAIACICAFAIAGCGSSSTSTATGAKPGDGKKIFTDAGCGGCHTLASAGTGGDSGPNLDELKPSSSEVASQVKNGGGGMPSFDGDLMPDQIGAVSEFVSSTAGQ